VTWSIALVVAIPLRFATRASSDGDLQLTERGENYDRLTNPSTVPGATADDVWIAPILIETPRGPSAPSTVSTQRLDELFRSTEDWVWEVSAGSP
jgi:hypothetical protein